MVNQIKAYYNTAPRGVEKLSKEEVDSNIEREAKREGINTDIQREN